MEDGEVVQLILSGAAPGEDKLDLMQLCLSATIAKLQSSQTPISDSAFYEILRSIGEILCPIFTPVKPPDYQENMVEARLSYAGIASDPDLQSAFAAQARELAAQGSLDSVEAAIDAQIWQNLQAPTRV